MTENQYVIACQLVADYSRLMQLRALNEYEQQTHESAHRLLYTYNVLAEKQLAARLMLAQKEEA